MARRGLYPYRHGCSISLWWWRRATYDGCAISFTICTFKVIQYLTIVYRGVTFIKMRVFHQNESCLFALSFLHNSLEDEGKKGSSHFDETLSLWYVTTVVIAIFRKMLWMCKCMNWFVANDWWREMTRWRLVSGISHRRQTKVLCQFSILLPLLHLPTSKARF